MSTTHKIEGYGLSATESFTSMRPAESQADWKPATLVIGGKCFTEEEHEAEFQRRVKLLVKEMLEAGTHNEDGWLTVRRQEMLGVLDRNGIKLP